MDNTRRFPGVVLSSLTATGLARRDRAILATCMVLITVLAWVYLVHVARQMSADMEHEQMIASSKMKLICLCVVIAVLLGFTDATLGSSTKTSAAVRTFILAQ